MAKGTSTRIIKVVADARDDAIKRMARQFAKMNKEIGRSNDILKTLRNAFFAIQGLQFAGVGIRELTQASDAYQKLGDRIAIFEGSQIAANKTMDKLALVADRTRTSMEGIATVYNRLALSLSDAGISGDSLLFVTEQLQNSFRLSGSTAAEATAATIQLSQGLASGTLRGQELRSVLESNVIIGGLLSKELNTTRGNLMKMAEAGEITADVFLNALLKGSRDMERDTKKLGITFAEATDRGLLKFSVALGKLNKQFDLSGKYNALIQGTVNNLDLLGVAMFSLATGAIPALIVKLKALWVTGSLVFAPITVAATLLGSAIGGLYLAFSENTVFEEFAFKLQNKIGQAFVTVGLLVLEVSKKIVTFFGMDLSGGWLEKKIEDLKLLKKGMKESYKEIEKSAEQIAAGEAALDNAGMLTFEQQLQKATKAFDGLGKKIGKGSKVLSLQDQIKKLNTEFMNGQHDVESYNSKLTFLTTELYKGKGNIKLADKLDKLRKENLQRLFEYGEVGAEEFQRKMNSLEVEELNQKLKTGRIGTLDFYEGMKKLSERVWEVRERLREISMDEFNAEFRSGTLSITEYNRSIESLKIQELSDKFNSGKMGLSEYNQALVETSNKFQPGAALSTGLDNYIKSAGTLSLNIANSITTAFGTLEETFISFTETGKFAFKDFAKSVLADLNKVIIRSMVIRPLAQGILSFAGAGGAATSDASGTSAVNWSGPQNANYAAKGAAFDGGSYDFFAKGGLVSGRTPFNYAGGRGMMGEAGPEAIIPLKRNSNGELGVQGGGGSNVVVNVINNGGDSQVEQRESTNQNGDKVIDVIITQKVKETFANGSMDKQMNLQYGLKRRG